MSLCTYIFFIRKPLQKSLNNYVQTLLVNKCYVFLQEPLHHANKYMYI